MGNKNGWLANLFKPRDKKINMGFNDMVSMVGYEPKFSNFGSQVLYSNLMLRGLRIKQNMFAVLEPRHIKYEDGRALTVYDSTVAKVLRNPNHYQTSFDFLSQAYFMRDKDKTCYILLDRYKTTGGYWYYENMFVLLPSNKPELREENSELFWVFTFDGWSEPVVFNYADIVPWKTDIEDNQYMGGGRYSTNANADLLNSLQAHRTITESVAEASKLGCMFDGLLKVNAFGADDKKTQAIRDKFLEDIKNNKSGLPVLDMGAEYVQIQRQLKMVDGNTLKEIKENAVIASNVSIDVLCGKLSKEDKKAILTLHIKPAAISLEQALTKAIFSRANEGVKIYPHRSQQMDIDEVIELYKAAGALGVYNKDEWREMTGHEPLPNGEGKAMPRGYNNLDGATNDTGGVTE